MRELVFDINALEDLQWWIKNNKKVALKIISMVNEIERNPFEGLGKPEPLKHELSGCWSRRITSEDRIVYQVTENKNRIIQCKFHY